MEKKKISIFSLLYYNFFLITEDQDSPIGAAEVIEILIVGTFIGERDLKERCVARFHLLTFSSLKFPPKFCNSLEKSDESGGKF